VLINLTESEVKFVIHAVQESAAKILAKLEAKPVTTVTVAPVGTVRLTKAGRPAKKPGRKPGKKPVVKIVTPVEQAA
jgi:hypothetical protein